MATHPTPDEEYAVLFRRNVLRSVQALLVRARRETSLGLTETAATRVLAVLEYALELDETWPSVGELLRLLAPRFDLAGYRVQWLPYLERSVAVSVAHRDRKCEAALCCDLGLMHQRLGNLATAQELLGRACALARTEGEWATLCLALQRRAELARLHRRYQECEALLREAGALFAADHPAQAYGIFVAGKAAFDQHDLDAATTAFTQARRLWQGEDNSGRAALCIQNLGRIATARGDPQMAIPLYEQAIELLTAVSDWSNLAATQMNLGVTYYKCHQYTEALAFYSAAEIRFHTMNDDRHLAMIYNNLGLVYTALGELHEAEINLQRSITLYQQIGDNKAWISTKSNLGIVYLNQAQYPLAIQVLQEALTELQTTDHDPEYERLQQDLTAYLALAQARRVESKAQQGTPEVEKPIQNLSKTY